MQTFSFQPPDLPNSPPLSFNSTESVFADSTSSFHGIVQSRGSDSYRPMTADGNEFDEDEQRNLSGDEEGGDNTDSTSVDNAYKTHDDPFRTDSGSPPVQNVISNHNYGAVILPYGGMNGRNMRPMTAPSSISAPYGIQSNHYNNQPGSNYLFDFSNQQQVQTNQRFENQKERMDMMEYRRQCYDLPGIRREDSNGVLPDEPHRREESPPTFLHNLPPLREPYYEYPNEQQQQLSPEFDEEDSYSRPTTANERRGQFSAAPMHDQADSTYQETAKPSTQFAESKSYNFIASAGQAPKRPRRRYDEIERLYTCDYVGCKKAYGTLNHLNSHKTMQKHGPKSTPSQFKELRKAWRDGKKAAAAAQRKMSTEALASGRIESFPRGNSPPLRRPVTTGGDFAYQVPNPFLSSAPPNWAYRPEQDHRHQNDSYNSYSNLSMGSANGMNRPSTAPSFIPGFNGFPPPPALPSHQMLENIRRVSLPNSLPIDNFYGGGDESFENINEEEEIFDRGNQNNQNGGGPEEDGNYVPDNNYPDSN